MQGVATLLLQSPAPPPTRPCPQSVRFVERGVTGAELVRMSDGELRELCAPGQQPRVLRVLRAYDTFAEIDSCGERDTACACCSRGSPIAPAARRVPVLGAAAGSLALS